MRPITGWRPAPPAPGRATGRAITACVPYNFMENDPATDADEAHWFEPHYDRHVWIYRDNPNGVFAPFNPKVTCAHHRGAKSHTGAH